MRKSIRIPACLLLAASMMTLGGCIGRTESESQRRSDANSAAGKLGKAAHTVAVKTQQAAAVAGKKLEKAAHQAHEGWKEAARQDKTSNR